MEQPKKRILGIYKIERKANELRNRNSNANFTKNVGSTVNTPKPSDIQKIIKKRHKKEGE